MTIEGARFLLVEDNDAHAMLVLRSFQKNRVANQVDRVCDGEQALAYLRREAPYADKALPDVVLLDLKLPRLDGLEVLEIIKADEKLRKIPVVMLTTSDAERDLQKAYAHHVNSYLVKPVDFDQLRAMINDLGFYWSVWNKRPS